MARPDWRGAGISFALGMVAASGQAPFAAWWLALPAFAAIVARVAGAADARQACRIGWIAGAGYFCAALNWIVQPFLVDAARYGWMAPFALLLMGFGLALFWAAAAYLAGRQAGRARRALGFALALTLAETARGWVLTGFPWALPGHIWIDTPVAQLAAYIGPNGLTLLTLGLAALPVAWQGRRRVLASGLAVLLLGLSFGAGAWRLAQPEPEAPGLRLRLVQPNAEQHLKWDPLQAERLFQLQLDYTAALPRPDLVIWPETALPYLYEAGGSAAQAIADAAKGVPVALGVQRLEGEAAYNSLVVIGDAGQPQAVYDKHHLVPFGEYVPLGEWAYRLFGLRAFAAQRGYGYSAGPGAAVLDLAGLGKVLPLICYEAVFPQDLRAAPTRPDWLLHITNDAWFGTWTGPFQHAAQARLRAVEQGLPLVRVANTGVTQIVDARGRVVAGLEFGIAAYLDADLTGPLPITPFARWGEGPLLLLLAGLALMVFRFRKQPPLDAPQHGA